VNDVDTGAISPSGRFARMEAALERIELKLDLKADSSRVAELEAKHNALEESIRRMVSGETTSPMGQLYLTKFTDMEKSIESLELKDLTREAVLQSAKAQVDSRFRWLASGLAFISSLSIVISIVGIVAA
jgi:uncharacterized protein YdcH (DUF465 family)